MAFATALPAQSGRNLFDHPLDRLLSADITRCFCARWYLWDGCAQNSAVQRRFGTAFNCPVRQLPHRRGFRRL